MAVSDGSPRKAAVGQQRASATPHPFHSPSLCPVRSAFAPKPRHASGLAWQRRAAPSAARVAPHLAARMKGGGGGGGRRKDTVTSPYSHECLYLIPNLNVPGSNATLSRWKSQARTRRRLGINTRSSLSPLRSRRLTRLYNMCGWVGGWVVGLDLALTGDHVQVANDFPGPLYRTVIRYFRDYYAQRPGRWGVGVGIRTEGPP